MAGRKRKELHLATEQQDLRPRARQRLKLNPPKPPNQPGPSQSEPAVPESSHSETSTCFSRSVENYDIEPGVEAFGSPEKTDTQIWSRQEAQFIRSKSGLEENWIGIRPLGKGGYGVAGLWEMRGNDGELVKVKVRTRRSLR